MKERPILFSAPMVREILEGSKTQTRRVVKPQPYIDRMGNFCWNGSNFGQDFNGPHIQAIASPIPSSKTKRVHCPFGKPGDRLWVRETWQAANGDKRHARIMESPRPDFGWIEYAATSDDPPPKWRPSIHMPRWASRIDLEITGVRVERLHDITEEDAMAEGTFEWLREGMVKYTKGHPWEEAIRFDKENPFRAAFGTLWESLNGPGAWDANPWVWVIEFRRVKP